MLRIHYLVIIHHYLQVSILAVECVEEQVQSAGVEGD
jgi:hypothetical protein